MKFLWKQRVHPLKTIQCGRIITWAGTGTLRDESTQCHGKLQDFFRCRLFILSTAFR